MANVLLLQFDTDENCAERRVLIEDTGANLLEDEPRWPTFFRMLLTAKPDAIVISCGKLPVHGREAARYINDGFNTRNIPVIVTDVAPDDIAKTKLAAPKAIVVERAGLTRALKKIITSS
ncbi:MAG TPA: hypothetical protein VJN22_08745 [Candidatus Eremiobacteraceae bacterium]|nr:hypothetical protein [Candidatus Eremiobacteraceae bacterium]